MKKSYLALLLCLLMLMSSCAASGGDNAAEPGSADSGSAESESVESEAVQSPTENVRPQEDVPSSSADSEEHDTEVPPLDDDEYPEDEEYPEIRSVPLGDIAAVHIITSSDTTINRKEYVDCSIAVIDPSGNYKTVSDTDCSIKVRGHSSSRGEKKPFNFKFSSKQELLGLGKGKKWALLSNMYDKTQLRNLLAFGMADDIGMPYIQQSTFVDVYLNGEYLGIYQLCEPVDVFRCHRSHHFKQRQAY